MKLLFRDQQADWTSLFPLFSLDAVDLSDWKRGSFKISLRQNLILFLFSRF